MTHKGGCAFKLINTRTNATADLCTCRCEHRPVAKGASHAAFTIMVECVWPRGWFLAELGHASRYRLSFHAASDVGVFPPEVLAARMRREAESLVDWEHTSQGFAGLADFHAWLHSQHLCYAVRRQVRGKPNLVDNGSQCGRWVG